MNLGQDSWIPLVCCGILALAVIFAIAVCATAAQVGRFRKIVSGISCFLWAALFASIEILLYQFSASGRINEAQTFYFASCICVCAGGMIALSALVYRITEHSRALKLDAIKKEGISDNEDIDPSEATKRKRVQANKKSVAKAIVAMSEPSPSSKLANNLFSSLVSWTLPVFAIGATTVLCFIFLELPFDLNIFSQADSNMAKEMGAIAAVLTGCWLIFQRHPLGIILPLATSLVLGLAQFCKEPDLMYGGALINLPEAVINVFLLCSCNQKLAGTMLLLLALFSLSAGFLVWLGDPLKEILKHKEPDVISQVGKNYSEEEMKKRENLLWIAFFAKNFVALAISILLGLYLVVTPFSQALLKLW